MCSSRVFARSAEKLTESTGRTSSHWVGTASYDRVGLPSAFAWSIVPQSMSNFRAALHPDLGLGDDVPARVSTVVWSASLVAILLAAWRRPLPAGPTWALCTQMLRPRPNAESSRRHVCGLVLLPLL